MWFEVRRVLFRSAPSFGICAAELARGNAQPKSLLILGDPEQAEADFPKLPNAAVEISKLEERFPGPSTTVITGKDARPSAYFSAGPGRFSIIHIAAHGEANRR